MNIRIPSVPLRSFHRRALSAIAAFMAIGVAMTADGQSLTQHCLQRCDINLSLCLGSTLPDLQGGPLAQDADTIRDCTTRCDDTNRQCTVKCDPKDRAKCVMKCDNTLAACTTTCSRRTAGCNDKFVSCRRQCEARPQCTLDAQCGGGGACVSGKCEPGCRTSAECRLRMDDDTAVCVAPTAGRAKRCALS